MGTAGESASSDKLGDWRIDTVVTVAKQFGDVPVGTPVRLMSLAKHKKYKYLSFVTPSAPALCLNVAMNAATNAEAVRPRLCLEPMQTYRGDRGFQLRDECIADLYYFFEQSIVAVTMSFQALENLANAVIGRRAKTTIRVKRKGGVEMELNPRDAERQLSTEEKFGQVLPNVMRVPSPVGNRVWNEFKKLKTARDETVHLKSFDIYTRNQEERESLFFQFLANDAREYPSAAIKVMSHYFPVQLPRWLSHAKAIADGDSRFGIDTNPL